MRFTFVPDSVCMHALCNKTMIQKSLLNLLLKFIRPKAAFGRIWGGITSIGTVVFALTL